MSFLLSRRKLTEILTAIVIFSAMLGMILRPTEILEAAKTGLELCANVILPTLFPFFVLSNLLVELGFARYLGRAFEWIMRPLFNVNGSCAAALALGFVGGYPTGARTAISIYEKGLCTKTEAERLLAFCNNSGPAFILGVVGAGIFNNAKVGILLYLMHALASFLVGILFRFYKRGETSEEKAPKPKFEVVRLSKAFVGAVSSSFLSTLNICAFVVFFTVVIRMLFLFGIIPLLAKGLGALLTPFGGGQSVAEQLLTGLIEVSSGVWSLRDAAGALQGKLAMAAFMLGWAGISVHCQVLSFIGDSGLSTRNYIVGKFLHGVISAILVFLAAGIFQFEAPISTYLAEQLTGIYSMNFTSSLSLSLLVSAATVLLLLLFASTVYLKKHWKRRSL
ncbi:sporulation protein [Oscillospiraceae bacterium OttesenSCG-928-G22]|nr:sporulation protein [Oscillospiraceae bacterium OttesenSCG-928-G22]